MQDRLRRLALIGLPGAGKTTIGCCLARALRWTFVDCDAVFEAKAEASIREWVGEHGWPAFRERESAILADALAGEKVIIATGGGGVELEVNRSALGTAATVVWLDAPVAVLARRVGRDVDRPLLGDDSGARLAELAVRRKPLYAEVADLRIEVADCDPVEAASVIMRELALGS